MSKSPKPPQIPRLRAALLKWYRVHRRDLPWRRTKDPYAVWISEIMLQQTRVDTVRPYYETFLERWPDVRALAAADPDTVRAAWSGLGYYRRARLMLEAASVLVQQHEGEFPREAEDLRKLPGFGRYTAGAVASIAFDRPAPAVDGNVTRVLARLNGIEGDVTKGTGASEVWAAATALAAGESPGDLTQALIELGALVCTPRNPRCTDCPLLPSCRAHAQDRISEIPPPKKRAPRKSVALTALIMLDGPAVLLAQQPEQGLFASLWCPPLLEGQLSAEAAMDEAARALGFDLSGVRTVGQLRHVLTHRELEIEVMRADPPKAIGRHRWAPLAELEGWGIPSVTAKCLRLALTPHERAQTRVGGRSTPAAKAKRAGQGELPL